MSTLTLPRIIVSGEVSWNPNTVNNHDYSYDDAKVRPVLDKKSIDPYDDKTRAEYQRWLFQMTSDKSDLNGSWNVFGDYKVEFVAAKVTGTQPVGLPNSNDPLLNQPVTLGIPSGTPSNFARMVDVDPYGVYTTQIIYSVLSIGSPSVGVRGTGEFRMISRWLNPSRNLASNRELPIAGRMGVLWQATLPKSSLTWGPNYLSSAVLRDLMGLLLPNSPNQGLVFLFTAYRTLYFQKAKWKKDITNIEDLGRAYQEGFKDGNPALSALLGRVGIWGPGELATAPTDILLNPMNSVTRAKAPVASSPGSGRGKFVFAEADQKIPLGPAQARIVRVGEKVGIEILFFLVLDLLMTFPEQDATLAKKDLGTFTLRVLSANGSETTIATLPYDKYNRQAYESTGGIVSINITSDLANVIANGKLQLVNSSGSVVLEQIPLVSEADQRGIWVDEGTTATITVTIYQNGATPPKEAVKLLVVPYAASGLGFKLITDASQAIFDLLDGNSNRLPLSPVLSVGSDGTTKITVRPRQPGIGYYFLFPFTGSVAPKPPGGIDSVAPNNYFIVLRALPFDNALSGTSTWQKVYQEVLSTWDFVYPLMSQIIPLSNEKAVESPQTAAAIIQRLGENPLTSYQYMPISRDMSAGKKKLLVSYLKPFANPAGEKK